MKKLFFATALVALACAGCATEDEPVVPGDLAVKFTTEIASVTRTAPVVGKNFGTGGTFVVNATRKEGASGTASAWIENKTLTKSADGWNWAEGGALYFMKGYIYDFLAYAPATAALDMTAPTAVPYTVSNTLGEQKDLLYASANKDFTADPLPGSTVALTFNHALTQVSFTAKVAQDYAPYTATVTGIALNNVNSQGTMDLTKSPVVWAPASAPAVPLAYSVAYSQALTTTAAPLTAADVLMLMPQNPASVEIEVTFDVTGGPLAGTGKKISITLGADTKVWEAGWSYTYNITLKLDDTLGWTISGLDEPEINIWQDGGGIDVGN